MSRSLSGYGQALLGIVLCWMHHRQVCAQSFHTSKLSIDGVADHDQIGYSIAFRGNDLMIGSPYHDGGVGASMLFSRSGSSASFRKSFSFVGPHDYQQFGSTAALSSGHIFVGAPGESCYAGETQYLNCGGVFVYSERPAMADIGDYTEDNGWYRRSISPTDVSGPADFGASLAVSSNDVLAVGSPGFEGSRGAVNLYELDKETDVWQPIATFESPSRQYFGRFGSSLAFYGDVLAVGAPGDAAGELDGAGSVSIYTDLHIISGTTSWALVQRIFASDPLASAEFGISVSIYRNTLVVGAEVASGHSDSTGAAYVFEYSASSNEDALGSGHWSQIDRLIAHDGETGDKFGCSVSTHKDTIVVGAYGENGKLTQRGDVWQASDGENCGVLSDPECVRYSGEIQYRGEDAGAVYVFTHNNDIKNRWAPTRKLLPSESSRHWRFGWVVQTDGDTITVGADGASFSVSSSSNQVGAVYVVSIDWSGLEDALKKVLRGMLIGAGVISVVVFAYVVYLSKAHDYFMVNKPIPGGRGTALDVSNSAASATSSQFLLGSYLSTTYAPIFAGQNPFSSAGSDAGSDDSALSVSDRGLGATEWGISRPPRRGMV